MERENGTKKGKKKSKHKKAEQDAEEGSEASSSKKRNEDPLWETIMNAVAVCGGALKDATYNMKCDVDVVLTAVAQVSVQVVCGGGASTVTN